MNIDVQCPFHGEPEKIELPDSYDFFEGEIKCGATGGATTTTLRIKIVKGKLVSVERAGAPR